jgi:hypothetical protein
MHLVASTAQKVLRDKRVGEITRIGLDEFSIINILQARRAFAHSLLAVLGGFN